MPIRRADDQSYTLASNANATGSAVLIPGGQYIFMVDGTVGGSTVTLQTKMPNGTWANVKFYGVGVSATVLPYAETEIALPAGEVRVALTGGTPSAIYAYLVGLG